MPVVCFPERHHLTVRLERIHGHIESGGLEAVAVARAAVVVTQLAVAVGAVVLQVPKAFAKLGRSAADGAEGDGREKRRTLKHQEAEIGAGTADSVKFRQSLVTANAARRLHRHFAHLLTRRLLLDRATFVAARLRLGLGLGTVLRIILGVVVSVPHRASTAASLHEMNGRDF